jgi:hypothetical protein
MKKLKLDLKSIATDVSISDGYHTFDELYDHRIALYIALCKSIQSNLLDERYVWRSCIHSDGSNYDGWFLLGIGKEKGKQITYHVPNERWSETEFAHTLDTAPEYDGHTSDDVIIRLKNL